MKVFLLAALMSLTLVGCATDPTTAAAIANANAEIAKIPVFTVKCTNGCEASYTDPNRLGIAMPTNGWDVAKSIGNNITATITGAVPYVAIGQIANAGIKNAGNNDSSVHNTDNSNNSDNSNHSDNSNRSDNSDRSDNSNHSVVDNHAITDRHDVTTNNTSTTTGE